jgi:glycosyltransferase involved in cell wall biosynthesis
MKPRIVIGMPLHNEEKYAAQAIESFLAQTYPDFVLSVLDDASTDGTPGILADLARRDKRIVITRTEKRGGAIHAFRKVHYAGGESDYFSWAGGHDVWHPRWMETLLGVMEREPGIVLSYPLTGMIEADGTPMDVAPPRFDTYGLSPAASRAGGRVAHAGRG